MPSPQNPEVAAYGGTYAMNQEGGLRRPAD